MWKSTLGLAMLLSILGMQAFAAEEAVDKTYYFDEVVVTASGKPETLFTSKSNTQVITAEQIENMHYKSVMEAVRNVSGMQFVEHSLPGHEANSAFRINGSKEILVLIDGVRASMMGSGQSVIKQLMNDMASIERIEVMRGSAAVLYGSDAVGGVINIITKKVEKTQHRRGIEFGSFNHENYNAAHHIKIGDKTTVRTYVEKFHDGAYNDADDNKWESRKGGYDASINIAHEFSEGNRLSLDYRYADESWNYYDKLLNPAILGDGQTRVNNMVVVLDSKKGKLDNKFSFSYLKYEYNMNDLTTHSAYNEIHNNFKSFDFRDVLNYTTESNTLTFGLEHIGSVDLRNNNQYLNNNSLFVQDSWKFAKNFTLKAGVRYDAPDISNGDIDKNWSKSFNLGYDFNKNTNVYAAYNDYFVLPTMAQLYNENYGNPNLNAAKGKNYEVGLNHKFDQNNVVSVHYFYRKSTDYIDFKYTDYATWQGQYTNVSGEIKSHGFDVQYDKTFDGTWHAKLGYSHLTSEEDSNGYLPENQITFGVDYTVDRWNVGLDVRGYVGRNGKNVNDAAWPSKNYAVVDLGVNYKISKCFKLYGKINNLFNKLYAEQTNVLWGKPGEWYGMPGRTFIVGLVWTY